SDEAMEVIKRVALARRAPLQVVGNSVYVSTHHLPEVVSDDAGLPIYQAFSLAYEGTDDQLGGKVRVKLPLLGSHQQLNAATALAALRTLRQAEMEISRNAIARGFSKMEWPGRLEIARRNPIVVLDG